jgi:hypothetical protein
MNDYDGSAIAIDWSGAKAKEGKKKLFLAVATNGKLTHLDSYSRSSAIDEVIKRKEESVVVGIDFAFSFPLSFLTERGIEFVGDAWEFVNHHGEALLSTCPDPFFGRNGKKRSAHYARFRNTEIHLPPGHQPKSIFQLVGAGHVGTGSLRGMSFLPRLRAAGFSIWPFDSPVFPLVVEIYPALLTGRIAKRSREDREAFLVKFCQQHGTIDDSYLATMRGSEDALDAGVSAIEMSINFGQFKTLPIYKTNCPETLEGSIWYPGLNRTI